MPNLPETMTAIAIREPGGPDVLETRRIPRPDPGHGEILIRVEAAGVNRPDTIQRMGLYPPPGARKPDSSRRGCGPGRA